MKVPKELWIKLLNNQTIVIVLENARSIDNGRTVSAEIRIAKELLKSKISCLEFKFQD